MCETPAGGFFRCCPRAVPAMGCGEAGEQTPAEKALFLPPRTARCSDEAGSAACDLADLEFLQAMDKHIRSLVRVPRAEGLSRNHLPQLKENERVMKKLKQETFLPATPSHAALE